MISVIVVNKDNNNQLLNITLNSLNKQNNKNFEVLIGSSTGIEPAIPSSYHTYNTKGLNNIRNDGVFYAKHDVVTILDAGIKVSENWMNSIYNGLNKYKLLYGSVVLLTPEVKPWWMNKESACLLGEFFEKEEKTTSISAVSLNNFVFTKDHYKEAGGFNSEINTDVFFLRNILKNNTAYKTLDDNLLACPSYKLSIDYVSKLYYNKGVEEYLIDSADNHQSWHKNINYSSYIKYSKRYGDKAKEWIKIFFGFTGGYSKGYYDSFINSPVYKNISELNTTEVYLYDKPTEEDAIISNYYYDVIQFSDVPKVYLSPAKNDRCICVIAPDDFSKKELEYSKPMAMDYANQHGLDYIEVTQEINTKHKCGHKYILSQIADNYKQILYIDCDVIIMPNSPSIFDYINEEEWGLFNETPFVPDNIKEHLINEMEALSNLSKIPIQHHNWYNGGVIVAPNDCYRTYFPPKQPVPNVWCIEQHWLNLMLHYNNCKIQELDVKWNTGWTWFNFETLLKDAYFIHLNGCKHPLRLKLMQYFSEGNRGLNKEIKKEIGLCET